MCIRCSRFAASTYIGSRVTFFRNLHFPCSKLAKVCFRGEGHLQLAIGLSGSLLLGPVAAARLLYRGGGGGTRGMLKPFSSETHKQRLHLEIAIRE